jgi:hypothetical protein
MTYHHQYLCRIPSQTWEDLDRIRSLDNDSYNGLITQGIRLVVKQKLQELTTLRKNRTSLEDMVSV